MPKQRTKVLDMQESFRLVDPNKLSNFLSHTAQEDLPQQQNTVFPYEGYNFIPTAEGYRSFFGTRSLLDFPPLNARVDEIFTVQTDRFENVHVALTSTGIFTASARVNNGEWVHSVVMPDTPEGTIAEWSHTTISNNLYCYRAGYLSYFKMSLATAANSGAAVTPPSATSVVLVGTSPNITGLEPDTVFYSVAAFVGGGLLTAKSTELQVTNTVFQTNTIGWNAVAGATAYRLYIRRGATTYYKDIGNVTSYAHNGDAQFISIALPDTYNVSVTSYIFTSVVPSFLNMAGQLGLFKCNGRLAFWDSANSIGWSSIDDFADFTPSVKTKAGNTLFLDITGRIVNILSAGTGFVIYATKSVLHIIADNSSALGWTPNVLMKDAGIAFRRESTSAALDTLQFAMLSNGLYIFSDGKFENILVESLDFLKRSKDPIFLRILEGRYLFLEIIDRAYLASQVTFKTYSLGAVGGENSFNAYLSCRMPGQREAVFAALPPDSNIVDDGTYEVQVVTRKVMSRPVYSNLSPITYSPPTVIVNDNGVPTPGIIPGLNIIPAAPVYSHTQEEVISSDIATLDSFMNEQDVFWNAADGSIIVWQNAVRAKVAATSIPTGVVRGFESGGYRTVPENGGQLSSAFEDFTLDANAPMTVSGGEIDFVASERRLFSASVTFNVGAPTEITTFTTSVGDGAGFAAAVQRDTLIQLTYQRHTVLNSGEGLKPSKTELKVPYIWDNDITILDGVATYFRKPSATLDFEPTVAVSMLEGATLTGDVLSWISGISGTIGPSDVLLPNLGEGRALSLRVAGAMNSKFDEELNPTIVEAATIEIQEYRIINVQSQFQAASVAPNQIDPLRFKRPSFAFAADPIQFPAAAFLVQEGTVGPIYPTYAGAYVYDIFLKKWGKMQLDYKQLVSLAPVNSTLNRPVDYSAFKVEMGCLLPSGKIAAFDPYPVDSYIRYGKLAYTREGITKAEEVRVMFASTSTGGIKVESSLDGNTIEQGLIAVQDFVNVLQVTLGISFGARWHTIMLTGNYDVKYIEFRGHVSGNR